MEPMVWRQLSVVRLMQAPGATGRVDARAEVRRVGAAKNLAGVEGRGGP